jgi:hypothetical protein
MSRCLATVVLVGAALGCEASLTPAVTPNIDTMGRPGVETRADMTLGIGPVERYHFYFGGGPGVGYRQPIGPYFLHTAEVGVQFGGIEKKPLLRGRAGGIVVPRVGADGLYLGTGAVGDVLFGVAETQRPARGRILLGPRLQAECICISPRTPNPKPLGLLSAGVAMQWVLLHIDMGPRPESIRREGPSVKHAP